MIVHAEETTRPGETGETALTDLEAVANLHDDVLTGEVTVEEPCMSQELTRVILFQGFDVKNNRSKLHAQLSSGYSS